MKRAEPVTVRLRFPDGSERDVTFYEYLKVKPDATADELKAAYRKRAFDWHPDRNQDDPERHERLFKTLQTVWEHLGDPAKRSAYDARLDEYLHPQKQQSLMDEYLKRKQENDSGGIVTEIWINGTRVQFKNGKAGWSNFEEFNNYKWNG